MAAFIFAVIGKEVVKEGTQEVGVTLVEFDDACKAVAYYESSGLVGLSEDNDGEYQRALTTCGAAVSAVTPSQGDSTPAENADGLPSDNDSANQQGAPTASVDASLSAARLPEDLSNWSGPDLVFHQTSPLLPAEILDRLGAGDLPVDEAETLENRWIKNRPDQGERDPTHSGQVSRSPTAGADPVDLFHGLLVLTSVDLDISAPILALRLVRTYRSGRPYFGPWGFGWDHNYNIYLRELTDGGVAVWRGDLHEDYFAWTGETFEPEPGVHERLERLDGQPHSYLLTRPGGVTLRFQAPSGWTDPERVPLLEIRDRHGNLQKLTYDAENRLAAVADEDGRSLVFEYGDCGLLEAIADHTGKRRVRYEHHQEIEHLVRFTSLPTATYPNGASVCYEYDYMADHPAMRHNILRVVDAQGLTYLENEYGGPETGWAFNRVVKQLYGDFLYEIDYEQIQYVPENTAFTDYPAMQAAMRPPDGSLHTYTFNYRGDLLDYRFRLNLDGSSRVVAYQWEYDGQGNVTAEVSPDGGQTEFTFDAANSDPCSRGNLLKVELLAPPAFFATGRVVFQAAYDPLYQLPVLVVDEKLNGTRMTYDFDTNPGPGSTGRLQRVELPDATLADGTLQSSAVTVETNTRGQITATVSAEGIRHETYYFESELLRGFVQRTIQDAGHVSHVIEYAYDDFGQLATITTPLGVVTDLTYNNLGQLEEVVLPAVQGKVARIRSFYRDDGQLLRMESPRGDYADGFISGDSIADEFVVNVLGRTQVAIKGQNTIRPRRFRFCFDHRGRITEMTDPVGMRTRRAYDERGLPIAETVGFGTGDARTTQLVYNRAGWLERLKEPDGGITQLERDPWGHVSVIHLSNGSDQRQSWGTRDELLGVSIDGDPGDGGPKRLLLRRTFEYDEVGRKRRETLFSFIDDPDVAVELTTKYFYDRDGRLIKVVLPRGGTIEYHYDGLDRPRSITDVYGNVQQATYHPAGYLAQLTREEIEPNGVRTLTWQYTHDERGRLRRIIAPSGAATEFDYEDRDLVVERREPLDVIVRFRHGLFGEKEQELLDPSGLAIGLQYEYDLMARLVRFTDPDGQITTWTRDVLGRQLRMLLPDGSEWQRGYDPSALSMQIVTPGGSHVTFNYAPGRRLVKLSTTPGAGVNSVPTHEFTYDGLNRLVRAEYSAQPIERRYDSLGRIIKEITRGKSVHFEYDDVAATFDVVYPDGRRERAELDIGGRPQRISLVQPGVLGGGNGTLAEFAYGGTQRVHSIKHGNGVQTSLMYDEQLRLIGVEHANSGEVIESVAYRYDARNRRRVVQRRGPIFLTQVNEFDKRDRLVGALWGFAFAPLGEASSANEQDQDIASAETAAIAAPEWERYDLDPADSRLELVRPNGTVVYSYSSGHALTGVGPEVVTHHADGSRIADGSHKYDIDALGRVVRVRDATSFEVLAEFSYDALGRSAASHVGNQSILRWFAGERSIHEEDTNGAVLHQQSLHPLWAPPLVDLSAAGAVTLHTDGTLSTICGTGEDGSPVQRMRFRSFGAPDLLSADGNVLPMAEAKWDPIFAGLRYIAPLSLYSSRTRLYHPNQGLFLSRDPHLYASSPSPYLYANHNPVDFMDPLGFDTLRVTDEQRLALQSGLGASAVARLEDAGMIGQVELDEPAIVSLGPLQGGAVPGPTRSPRGQEFPAASIANAGGLLLRQAGEASHVTSIIWQGPAAKAFVYSPDVARYGFRALETTWLFRVTQTDRLRALGIKVLNDEKLVGAIIYHLVWKPVSFAYAFHAGVSGHQMIRLIAEEANVVPKGVGSIAMFVEVPAYRWGRAAIPVFRGIGTGLTFAGGAIDAIEMGDNLQKGNYIDATVNGVGVAGAAVTLIGSPTNPVGVGLTTFRVSYGLTYWALESLDNLPHVEPVPGEEQPSPPNPGAEGAGPTRSDPLPPSAWTASGGGGGYLY